MIKLLLASLTLLAPAISGGVLATNNQDMPVLQEKVHILSSESDEFLSYWKDDFRKDDNGNIISICDISYQDYTVMYSKYVALNSSDKLIVDKTPDYEANYTILDSIKELVRIYGNKRKDNQAERATLNQSSTIAIIVVIAVFGMSVICVFFVMKNTNLIQ